MKLDAVQALHDLEEIKKTKARYFRCVDQKRWDEFGNVFTVDAHVEFPEGDVALDGRDAIVAAVSGFLDDARTVHHGHMPEIEFIGPDSARGVWSMEDYVEFAPDADGSRRGLRGYGHYEEEYQREDGEWRIARLLLTRLRVDWF